MSAVWEPYALAYAARGWRVLLLEPGGKKPLRVRKACLNGVNDATADPHQIKSWAWRFPDSNLGIATGAPGPHVQDFDDLEHEEARSTLAGIDKATTPTVATPGENHPPGWHFYFRGLPNGSAKREWGELRGKGLYIVAPPSVFPWGAYEWTVEPNGTLPELPAFLAARTSSGTGTGEQKVRTDRVPHGERHDYLVDFATRLVRGGITDRACIETHLWCEFQRACEPLPEPQTIPGIAKWASDCDIAHRERALADFAARWNGGAA